MEVAEPWIAALLADNRGPLNELLATSEAVLGTAVLVITKPEDDTTPAEYVRTLYGLTQVNGELSQRIRGMGWVVADAIREIATHTGETTEAVLHRLAERHTGRD